MFCAMIRPLALLTSLLFNLELILFLFMTQWKNKVNIYIWWSYPSWKMIIILHYVHPSQYRKINTKDFVTLVLDAPSKYINFINARTLELRLWSSDFWWMFDCHLCHDTLKYIWENWRNHLGTCSLKLIMWMRYLGQFELLACLFCI